MAGQIKVMSNEQDTGSISVAFATNDTKNIDAHFGSAKEFYVYDISTEGNKLSSVIKIDKKDVDGSIVLLKTVDIVYFVDIGPTAAAKIIRNGIFPIKYKEIISIEEELTKLQKMLGTNPPPFIKKIIERKAA